MNLVYLNGIYLSAEEARIPVTDRGLAYGDGVFTTIKVSRAEPRFLDWHLERLARDAKRLFITAPPAGELEGACRGLVSRLEMEDGVLKVTVTRGSGGRGPSTKYVFGPTVIVAASSLPEARPALRAITVPDDRGPLAAHKTLNYLPNVLALRRAEAAGCDEALFVRDGALLEATVSNLVGLYEGRLLTPPLDGGVLDGVARRALLENGTVGEGAFPPSVPGPLYCINSVRGVEVVAELDGRRLVGETDSLRLLRDALTDSELRNVSSCERVRSKRYDGAGGVGRRVRGSTGEHEGEEEAGGGGEGV